MIKTKKARYLLHIIDCSKEIANMTEQSKLRYALIEGHVPV